MSTGETLPVEAASGTGIWSLSNTWISYAFFSERANAVESPSAPAPTMIIFEPGVGGV